jgi:hypothetical protein
MMVYKILLFLKRRPGMAPEAFRDYYENVHVPLCLKYSRGVSRYFRRYLDPMPDPATGEAQELPFDVITELWFDDEAIYRATVEFLSGGSLPQEVIDDEERLFDRSKSRFATVEEIATL